MYFQPIKNEDPQLDFYTVYKREATEYDTENMRKYNEDLNTTLIFVRYCYPLDCRLVLTDFSGRSILCSQFRLRHRCPVKTWAGFQREVGNLPPCNPSQSQSLHSARRTSHNSSHMGRPLYRHHRNHRPSVCKPFNVAVGRICRDVGQAVVKPVPPTCWWIND